MSKAMIDITSDEFNQNLHSMYKKLRRESPVVEVKAGMFGNFYLLTKYDDVASALKNRQIVRNIKSDENTIGSEWMPAKIRAMERTLLNTDHPDHRRLRSLVHKAFTPRMITNLEPHISQIAGELIGKAKEKGTVDLLKEFALPLPIIVISEMLGVPEEDRAYFFELSKKTIVNPTLFNLVRAFIPMYKMLNYLEKLVAERQRYPQDDLVSALVLARDEGDKLNDVELLSMLWLLLVAGHETTVGLITNGTRALLTHPEQLARLRADDSLLPSAVEEILRFDGPIQMTETCYATEDLTVRGVTIPARARIAPAIISANRDEEQFENADLFDIGRKPNKHLAFGIGIHYCLGAPLARMEGQIAFRTLLEESPNLRLAVHPSQIRNETMAGFNRLEALPIVM